MFDWLRKAFKPEEKRLCLSERIVQELELALSQRPEDFKSDKFNLIDNSTGIRFWIANQGEHFRVDSPIDIKIGSYHPDEAKAKALGIRAYNAFLKWREKYGEGEYTVLSKLIAARRDVLTPEQEAAYTLIEEQK